MLNWLIDPIRPRYNAAPGQNLPVIRNTSPDKIHLMRWGLIPAWAKSSNHEYHLINARAETISEKNVFRSAFRGRRCLVLADGFYEWSKSQGRKTPYRITLRTETPFAFAGIWSIWTDQTETNVHSFSIITTEANSLVAEIHQRMPVILFPEDEKNWLTLPPEDGLKLLTPYPTELMQAYPVSSRVNSPKNDSPDIIKPVRVQKDRVKRLDDFF